MNKESLLKARDFLVNIHKLDIPAEDRVELMSNLWLLLDPDNYDKHMKCLMENFNDELRFKKKHQ